MKREQRAALKRMCDAYCEPLAPLPVRLVRFLMAYRALRTIYSVRVAARVAWQIEVDGSPF